MKSQHHLGQPNRKVSEHMIYRGPWSEEKGDLEGHKAKEEDEISQCSS